MIKQPIMAAKQVATKTAPLSIPALASMVGLTKMMYAMVKKVVNPANTSVFTVVLFCVSLNWRSNQFIPSVVTIFLGFSSLSNIVLVPVRSEYTNDVIVCVKNRADYRQLNSQFLVY